MRAYKNIKAYFLIEMAFYLLNLLLNLFNIYILIQFFYVHAIIFVLIGIANLLYSIYLRLKGKLNGRLFIKAAMFCLLGILIPLAYSFWLVSQLHWTYRADNFVLLCFITNPQTIARGEWTLLKRGCFWHSLLDFPNSLN